MRNICLLWLVLLQISCSSQFVGKINGISFVASRDRATEAHIAPVKNIHAGHAAVMPFGFIREVNSPDIIFDTDRQWYGETRMGAKQYIELLHRNGIRVMVKPQIWIWRGVFTGELQMDSEENWKQLEKSYEDFILTYASLAEETGAEIFCIGTELERFVDQRPAFWTGLIRKIRERYKGKLTYAANWDEYGRTPFWASLDYIGIDAYFPLSESKTPTVEELKEGWRPWKDKIAALSEQLDRPVLFTEFGYRSMDYTAKKPWLMDRDEGPVNLEGQVNAKKAIFESFWDEKWFAGGFVWKWFINHDRSGGPQDNRFTPQNKPAQEVISTFFKLYR
ncbi:glycoside hydrolase family 113 [Muriicola jejuensis]|uniref:Glycoside hydrolase n=1 Tax=Muriicola jejuensis TaxID=504488 RepID=A0A6P0UCQ5_9FLAO|nr:glycoside hydrolase TIM-barrel-like domain-containing protein [Muriicola jejuensis]NER10372.1 glycoside hydrolase [Muriicola jejuensis]